MLNYNHLHYFHVAASEGSVAGAADRLGVTQPTVSEQVRALEKTLGVVLFERTPTGLKLTDPGRLAFQHTSVMFRAGERLVESLVKRETEVPSTLRVGMTGSVARSATTVFLTPLLALEECVPTIRQGEVGELVRELQAGSIDLVLSESELSEAAQRGLSVVRVAEPTLVAIASPASSVEASWRNLRLIQYPASSSYRWDVEKFLDESSFHPRVAAEVDDSLFMVEAAARAGYVAFVTKAVARDAMAAGRVRVLASLAPAHGGVFAMYQDRERDGLVRRAVELLIECVQT
jgi:LysR family transcriptional regulator, transcriptional activator of nhaA